MKWRLRRRGAGPTAMSDLVEVFANYDAWNTFESKNGFIFNPEYIKTIVEHATTKGVRSALLGYVGPERVEVVDENYRESLLAAGLNPRHRAIIELVASEPWFHHPTNARIYAAEALSPFALTMRGRFPRFIGSEYLADEAARGTLYPIEFQDLTNLTLHSDIFDCVITSDVLEHVPNIDRCLRELARVLRPGGVMLSTFPFCFEYENIEKARIVEGVIEYLVDPAEYHGNPTEPGKGSLVFVIPGWKILEMAQAAGFSRSEMTFTSSVEKGITGAGIAGILVLRCYR